MRRLRPFDVFNALAVPLVLGVLGVVFVAQQNGRDRGAVEVSVAENRALAPFPVFTWESLLKGDYTRALDLYVADHFPFRDAFFAVADAARAARGVRTTTSFYEARDKDEGGLEDVGEWVGADAGVAGDPNDDVGAVVVAGIEAADAGPKKKKKKPKDGVIVAGDRALMLFTGDEDDARRFADVINAWRAALPDAVALHAVVTPTALPFYVPADQRERTNDEAAALAALRGAVGPRVTLAEVYGALALHADEDIFFKTDHHWTALGAYYGYRAFCAAAGLVATPIDTLTRVDGRPAPGSLYRMTKDPRLLALSPVSLWLPPVAYTAHKAAMGEPTATHPATFIDPREKGYLAFLGGDHPLMVATTDVKSGRRALVVKNSYGNAFAPWLLPHYEKLVVVDYRYYAGSVQKLVREHAITDVILVNATTTMVSRPHQRRLLQSLKGTGETWEPVTAASLAREAAEKQAREEAQKNQQSGGVKDAGVEGAP